MMWTIDIHDLYLILGVGCMCTSVVRFCPSLELTQGKQPKLQGIRDDLASVYKD